MSFFIKHCSVHAPGKHTSPAVTCPPELVQNLQSQGDFSSAQPLMVYVRYQDRRTGLFIVWGYPHWFLVDVPPAAATTPDEVLDILNTAFMATSSWQRPRPPFHKCTIKTDMIPLWKYTREKKSLFKVETHNYWALKNLKNYLPVGWTPYNVQPDAALKFMVDHVYTTFQWYRLCDPHSGVSHYKDERFEVDVVQHLWWDKPFEADTSITAPCKLLSMSCDIEVRTTGRFPRASSADNPICSVAVFIGEGDGSRIETTRGIILHTMNALGGDTDFDSVANRFKTVDAHGIIATEWIEMGHADAYYDAEVKTRIDKIRHSDAVYETNSEDSITTILSKHKKERKWLLDRARQTAVVQCSSERELLLNLLQLVRRYLPDLFLTYHGAFDIGYMFARAEYCGCLDEFSHWAVDRMRVCKMSEKLFQSAAQSNVTYAAIEGTDYVALMDVWKILRCEKKLDEYGLGAVATEILCISKVDGEVNNNAPIVDGTDRVQQVGFVFYNLVDALLTFRLPAVLQIPDLQMQFAKLVRLGLSKIVDAGQQAKIRPIFQSYALQRNYFMRPKENKSTNSGYQGAKVLEPKKGFYNVWVATLDFNSLYPSMIIAYNYGCDSDASEEQEHLPESALNRAPSGGVFVKPSVHTSLVASICTELTRLRAQYVDLKKKATTEGNAELADVYNVAQLAAKTMNNSAYGSLGSEFSIIYNKSAAAAVTASGRAAIEKTMNLVNTTTTLPGYAKFCLDTFPDECPKDIQDSAFGEVERDVIYGDTDSVMVKIPKLPSWLSKPLEKRFLFGMLKVLAAFVSSHFPPPMRIVPEKIAATFLMLKKKRYIARIFTEENDPGKTAMAGIQVVRRDSCPLYRRVMQTAIHKIFVKNDLEGGKKYIYGMVRKMFIDGATPLSEFLLTKELKHEARWSVLMDKGNAADFVSHETAEKTLIGLIHRLLPPGKYTPVQGITELDVELENLPGWIGTMPSKAEFLRRAHTVNMYTISYPQAKRDPDFTHALLMVRCDDDEIKKIYVWLDTGYASQQGHANAVRRYMKDNPDAPSMVGTRVSYVIVKLPGERALNKNVRPRLYKKTVLADVVRNNPTRYPLDIPRYFDGFFLKPLSEILDTINGTTGGFARQFQIFQDTGRWDEGDSSGIKRYFSQKPAAVSTPDHTTISDALPIPEIDAEYLSGDEESENESES